MAPSNGIRGTGRPRNQNMSKASASLPAALVAAIVLLAITPARAGQVFEVTIPPQYAKLKNLHLDIPLVEGGKPSVAIVVPACGIYRTAAPAIQRAIEKRTGAKAPIVSDDSAQAAVPIKGNLIVLGNRSTNKTICAL